MSILHAGLGISGPVSCGATVLLALREDQAPPGLAEHGHGYTTGYGYSYSRCMSCMPCAAEHLQQRTEARICSVNLLFRALAGPRELLHKLCWMDPSQGLWSSFWAPPQLRAKLRSLTLPGLQVLAQLGPCVCLVTCCALSLTLLSACADACICTCHASHSKPDHRLLSGSAAASHPAAADLTHLAALQARFDEAVAAKMVATQKQVQAGALQHALLHHLPCSAAC